MRSSAEPSSNGATVSAAARRCRCCPSRWKPLLDRQPALNTPTLLPHPPQADKVGYEHILLAILDSNPVLSSASRSALQTAASLATQNACKL